MQRRGEPALEPLSVEPGPAGGALPRAGPVRVATPDGPAWLLTSYADVRRGLADPRLSPCARHARGADYRGFDLPPVLRHNIINAEPADHARLRRAVRPLMDRRAAARLRPALRSIAARLLAPLTGFDLVRDLAGPYVAQSIGTWLGLPAPQRRAYEAWAARIVGPDWATLRARDTLPEMAALAGSLPGLLPGDMSPDEHTAMVFYLTFVWYEVCVNAIAADLVWGPGALRSDPPQPVAYRRFATVDLPLDGGTGIGAGQTVLMSLAAANADPAGAGRPHLSFGHGPNRCAGKALAYALIGEARRAAVRAGLAYDLSGLRWTDGVRARGPRLIRAYRTVPPAA